MSETTTALRDPLEAGSGLSVPTISWPNHGKKNPLKGIVVPVVEDGVQKPYRVTQQTKMGSNELLWFDEEKTQPRTQIEITLLTELRDWAGTSDNFQEARENDDEPREDYGLRRLIIKGKDGTNLLRDTLKSVKVGGKALRKPEIGGTLSQTLEKKVREKGSEYDTNTFSMEYEVATPETVSQAQAAATRWAEEVEAFEGSDDDGGSTDGDGPQFG